MTTLIHANDRMTPASAGDKSESPRVRPTHSHVAVPIRDNAWIQALHPKPPTKESAGSTPTPTQYNSQDINGDKKPTATQFNSGNSNAGRVLVLPMVVNSRDASAGEVC